jgi:hypothetical protein
MKLIKLFISGFLQVYFIAINTYCIAKEIYYLIPFAVFSISFLWTYNVKRISIANIKERFVYCIGAVFGNILGIITVKFLYRIFI